MDGSNADQDELQTNEDSGLMTLPMIDPRSNSINSSNHRLTETNLNFNTVNGSVVESASSNPKYLKVQTMHVTRKGEEQIVERNNSIATEDLKELRGTGIDTGLINLRMAAPDRLRSKSNDEAGNLRHSRQLQNDSP